MRVAGCGSVSDADDALGLVEILATVQRYLEYFRRYLSRSLGVVVRRKHDQLVVRRWVVHCRG